MSYNSRYRTRFSRTHGRLDLVRYGGSNNWCEVDGLVPSAIGCKILERYHGLGGRNGLTLAFEEGVPRGWVKLEAFVERSCGLRLRELFRELAADPALAA
jgi:hypothetical protein